MAKINRVHVQFGATINIGGYESAKLRIGARADVKQGETVDDVYDEVTDWIVDRLRREVSIIKRGELLDKDNE